MSMIDTADDGSCQIELTAALRPFQHKFGIKKALGPIHLNTDDPSVFSSGRGLGSVGPSARGSKQHDDPHLARARVTD